MIDEKKSDYSQPENAGSRKWIWLATYVSGAMAIATMPLTVPQAHANSSSTDLTKRVLAVRANLQKIVQTNTFSQSVDENTKKDEKLELAQYWSNWANWSNWPNGGGGGRWFNR